MTDKTPTRSSAAQDHVRRLALRPRDCAIALGISERLLWAKTKSGEIPHCRIGTAVVYPMSLLQEYLEKSAKGGENHG